MKLPNLKKTRNIVIASLLGVLAIFLVLAATKNNSSRRCKGLDVRIKDNTEQFLITNDDIEKWVTNYGNDPFEGKIIENITLSKVEKRVTESGNVKSCQAYFDLQGKLVLDIEAYKPVARILSNNSGPDRLIDEDGNIFPVSKHFSPTVLLISGPYVNSLKSLKSEKNQDLLSLINVIHEDEFWEAQITQIEVDKDKEIQLLPLFGKNTIEFGKPEKINSKLHKLMVFYKQILTQKDWSEFSKVSVKYEGQIVCN